MSKLVQDLKSYDLSVMPTSSSRFNESMSASASLDSLESREGRGLGVALPIGLMLDNAMEEIFTPYIEGAKYLEKESKSLGELYAVHLAKFTKYHVSFFLWHDHILLPNATSQSGTLYVGYDEQSRAWQ